MHLWRACHMGTTNHIWTCDWCGRPHECNFSFSILSCILFTKWSRAHRYQKRFYLKNLKLEYRVPHYRTVHSFRCRSNWNWNWFGGSKRERNKSNAVLWLEWGTPSHQAEANKIIWPERSEFLVYHVYSIPWIQCRELFFTWNSFISFLFFRLMFTWWWMGIRRLKDGEEKTASNNVTSYIV